MYIDRVKDEKLSEIFGSPYYIAPEIIKGSYDHKVSIWSLGVIKYAMLTKTMPFDADNDEELVKKI